RGDEREVGDGQPGLLLLRREVAATSCNRIGPSVRAVNPSFARGAAADQGRGGSGTGPPRGDVATSGSGDRRHRVYAAGMPMRGAIRPGPPAFNVRHATLL